MAVTKEQLDKDVIYIASASELSTPSKVVLPEPEPSPGLILPDGSINWGCPCLGGMATGPCGPQFREAFTCFHYSESDPKGSECYEKFSVMQECMSQYPELYGRDNDDDEAQSLMDAQKDPEQLIDAQKEGSLAETQKESALKPGPAGDPA